MVISDIDYLKKNLSDFCGSSKKKILFLENINGKRNYRQVAEKINMIHANNCIPWINEAVGLHLIEKDEQGFLKKCLLLKGRDIKKLLRKTFIKETPSIRTKKIADLSISKKLLKKYILDNFGVIENYFDSENFSEISKEEIGRAIDSMFLFISDKKVTPETAGLEIRFFTAFADYFNQHRADSPAMFNKFSAIVKLYEPFLKKYALVIKEEQGWSKSSDLKSLINFVYNINDSSFDVKETKREYWIKRTPKETSIRIAFKHRNIEVHSATSIKPYEMDKIVYFVFVAMLFLFL